MDFEHVITFVGCSESEIGLNSFKGPTSTVVPAIAVLRRIKKPNGDPNEFVTKHALERFEEAQKFLERLGSLMVEVSAFGMVVGEYMVRPYFIRLDEYALIRKYKG
jgi:hypothetical protein